MLICSEVISSKILRNVSKLHIYTKLNGAILQETAGFA